MVVRELKEWCTMINKLLAETTVFLRENYNEMEEQKCQVQHKEPSYNIKFGK